MTRGVETTLCDYHYDVEGGCEGVYGSDGRCVECGRPSIFQEYDFEDGADVGA